MYPIEKVTQDDYLKLKAIFSTNSKNLIVRVSVFKELIDECKKKGYCNKEDDLIVYLRKRNCEYVINEKEYFNIKKNYYQIINWLLDIKSFDLLLDCENNQLINISDVITLSIKNNEECIINIPQYVEVIKCILEIKSINQKIKQQSDEIVLLEKFYIELENNKDRLACFLTTINNLNNLLTINEVYKEILFDIAYKMIDNFFCEKTKSLQDITNINNIKNKYQKEIGYHIKSNLIKEKLIACLTKNLDKAKEKIFIYEIDKTYFKDLKTDINKLLSLLEELDFSVEIKKINRAINRTINR